MVRTNRIDMKYCSPTACCCVENSMLLPYCFLSLFSSFSPRVCVFSQIIRQNQCFFCLWNPFYWQFRIIQKHFFKSSKQFFFTIWLYANLKMWSLYSDCFTVNHQSAWLYQRYIILLAYTNNILFLKKEMKQNSIYYCTRYKYL